MNKVLHYIELSRQLGRLNETLANVEKQIEVLDEAGEKLWDDPACKSTSEAISEIWDRLNKRKCRIKLSMARVQLELAEMDFKEAFEE